jgi:hypothetical protein
MEYFMPTDYKKLLLATTLLSSYFPTIFGSKAAIAQERKKQKETIENNLFASPVNNKHLVELYQGAKPVKGKRQLILEEIPEEKAVLLESLKPKAKARLKRAATINKTKNPAISKACQEVLAELPKGGTPRKVRPNAYAAGDYHATQQGLSAAAAIMQLEAYLKPDVDAYDLSDEERALYFAQQKEDTEKAKAFKDKIRTTRTLIEGKEKEEKKERAKIKKQQRRKDEEEAREQERSQDHPKKKSRK